MDTLFGEIIESLKKPETGGDVFSLGKKDPIAYAKKIGVKMRDEILLAKRYHLSSDFSKSATLLAYNVQDPVADLIEKARVPFESMWVEWSLQARLEAIGLEIDPNAPRFGGVMIKRIKNSPSHFMITTVATVTDPKRGVFVDWCPVSIEVVLTKPIDYQHKLSQVKYFKYPLLEFNKGIDLPSGFDENEFAYFFLRASLIGGKTELEELDYDLKLAKIADYATHCITPFYGENYYNAIKNESIDSDIRRMMVKTIGEIVSLQAGLYRFVLSVLALLNDKDYIQVSPIKPGASRPGLSGKPKLQPNYNFVTMTAPHNVFIRDKQGNSEAKREMIRHEVTGTWVNLHRTGEESCEHAFANMDETGNRKICMLCGRKKTWRREHERGNIELGFKPRTARLVLDH